jgi:hypothetical protein
MHFSEKVLVGTVYIHTHMLNQIFRLESAKKHINDLGGVYTEMVNMGISRKLENPNTSRKNLCINCHSHFMMVRPLVKRLSFLGVF